ncbi:cytochrome c [Tuwongella immobilis]|uniref:Family transcriptional regulator n=1 Tax=Tuwongella immobilis TaxID=692036 RepID=A0A6C2YP66_9BACT|nr:cytochrome c [Tuwongella immobilis]VIP02672.1 family transcriptional regulator : [Tuwongella immobilis]VTS02105.1 family transcriptional regulator : [Tuwongella immobilis]
MKIQTRPWFLMGLSSLFLGLLAISASDRARAAAVATSDFQAAVESEISYLKKRLGEPKADKALPTLKTAAFIIAHLAQNQIAAKTGDAKQLATLRDAALEVAAAVNKKDLATATKLASGLSVDIKASASANPAPVTLVGLHDFELHTLMSPFRIERANGRGYEKAVRDFAKSVKNVDEAISLGVKLEAYAELTAAMAPDDEGSMKTKANWVKWSNEMKKNATDAVAALKKGKAGEKTAAASFKKLDASCTACHNVFRE